MTLEKDKLILSLRELRRKRPFDADNLSSRLRFVQAYPTSLPYINAVTIQGFNTTYRLGGGARGGSRPRVPGA